MQRKKIVLILSCLIVLIIGGLSIFLILDSDNSSDKQMYRKKISAANKFVQNEQWDDAIVAYQEAIEYDDKNEEAYIMLAQIYIYKNMLNDAEDILLKGIEKAGSQKIKDMHEQYFGGNKANSGNKKEQNLEINTALLKQISTYKLEDYIKKYGYASYDIKTGACEVKHNNLQKVLFNYVNDGNDVLDASSGRPKENKMPAEVYFEDLSVLFSGEEGTITFDQLKKMNLSNLRKDKNITYGLEIVYFEANNCTIEVESDENGNITVENAWNCVTPKDINNESDGDKLEVEGVIVSALTGEGVSDATLYVRDRGKTTGEPIAEIRTENDGRYSAELEAGEYTAEVEKDGYITENIDFEVDKWGDLDIEQFVISEELGEGEIRIVLEWGEYPRDLDSHLEGNTSTGRSIHVFYGNKEVEGANLDVDDISSFGPETITITDIGGEYEYYVYDYTMSGNIGTSGATVKVYTPGSSAPKVYSVPAITGNTWNVFSIRNGQVID